MANQREVRIRVAADDRASSTFDRVSESLKRLNQTAGGTSDLKRLGDIMRGAGAVAGLAVAGQIFERFASTVGDAVYQLKQGEISVRDMTADLARSVPILGSFVRGWDSLRGVTAETAAYIEQITKAARAQDLATTGIAFARGEAAGAGADADKALVEMQRAARLRSVEGFAREQETIRQQVGRDIDRTIERADARIEAIRKRVADPALRGSDDLARLKKQAAKEIEEIEIARDRVLAAFEKDRAGRLSDSFTTFIDKSSAAFGKAGVKAAAAFWEHMDDRVAKSLANFRAIQDFHTREFLRSRSREATLAGLNLFTAPDGGGGPMFAPLEGGRFLTGVGHSERESATHRMMDMQREALKKAEEANEIARQHLRLADETMRLVNASPIIG